MPGEDGMSLVRMRETMTTPIMLLTAKGETEDRIEGLEAGADDYLPKPFEPKELLAAHQCDSAPRAATTADTRCPRFCIWASPL